MTRKIITATRMSFTVVAAAALFIAILHVEYNHLGQAALTSLCGMFFIMLVFMAKGLNTILDEMTTKPNNQGIDL